MDQGELYIGTSGWSYKHWKGTFYPEKLPASKQLDFYLRHYNAVELNGSFYRLPSAETIENWMSRFPEGFKVCAKANRFTSHLKKLHDPEITFERFFSVFDSMIAFMGPILVQLPANLAFHEEVAENFYKVLSRTYSAYRFAIEVRHPTWFTPQSIGLMKQYGVTLVIAQSSQFPYHEEITARDVYLRLHGPGKLYDSSYSSKELADFAARIREWRQSGHDVWVFFNNDVHTYAIDNANTLRKMLGVGT
ncbi:DUF72 domain-containing protein [Pedobacter yulinensis]|uniref:DUF72 domain-containing protein n=1 Tax=Pedobacter yulinensis TaxID=2126353 RepID=A0A2T3HJW1_9SPHI|nr:DUF72 domain-containing protein [Pedobacter yulinensis]PST82724.1 DUF72 domain-containing protein [Pedobacter yulinensis]